MRTSLDSLNPPTPWQAHVAGWKGCTRCDLHKTRSSVVLARGQIPCDVLFVGEAPGASEDALGKPFVGDAGNMLDGIVEEVLDGTGLRVAFTNVLACYPGRDEDGDFLHPRDLLESVYACSPRLAELVEVARPKLIVRLGKDANDFLSPGYRHSVKLGGWKGRFADLVHPSAIVRAETVAQKSSMRLRAVVVLRNAVESL